jgi:hypothetical protein
MRFWPSDTVQELHHAVRTRILADCARQNNLAFAQKSRNLVIPWRIASHSRTFIGIVGYHIAAFEIFVNQTAF